MQELTENDFREYIKILKELIALKKKYGIDTTINSKELADANKLLNKKLKT